MKSSNFLTVFGLMALAFLMGYFMSSTMESYPLEGRAVSVRRGDGQQDYAQDDDSQHDNSTAQGASSIDQEDEEEDDRYPPLEPFLPLQPWEFPDTCDSRPSHIPDYCCYGGVQVFREYCGKFNRSTLETLENYAQHYRQHKRHDFFHSPTTSASPCDECQIADYMLKHNLTVTFLGDSVTDQTWVGLDCGLRRRGYRIESKTIIGWRKNPPDLWWKYGLGDHRILKLVGGPNGVTGEARLVYVKTYRRPTYGAEFFHIFANTDVLIFDNGLHWQPKLNHEFRSEMVEYLKHFRQPEARHIRLVAWRETPPQHFNFSGGHYVPGIEKNTKECSPIRGNYLLPDDDPTGYHAFLMKNATAEAGLIFRDAMQPNFTRTLWNPFELVMLPFREFARELYYNHPHAGDCTHFCNTPLLYGGVWRSLRLAMDRAYGPHPSIGKGYADIKGENYTRVISVTRFD